MVVLLVAGCTSSKGRDGSTRSTTRSSAPVARAPLPGLTATALLPRMKTLLGADATVQKSTLAVPSGQADYDVDTPRGLAGPGDFAVYVAEHDDRTVYSVLCQAYRARLGHLPAQVALCANLRFPDVDNARVRSWIVAQTKLPTPATLQLGDVSYSLAYADGTMSLGLDAATGQS